MLVVPRARVLLELVGIGRSSTRPLGSIWNSWGQSMCKSHKRVKSRLALLPHQGRLPGGRGLRREAVQVEKPQRIKEAVSVEEGDDQTTEKASKSHHQCPGSGCFPGACPRSCSVSPGFSPYRPPCPGKSWKESGPAPVRTSARRPGAAQTTEKR